MTEPEKPKIGTNTQETPLKDVAADKNREAQQQKLEKHESGQLQQTEALNEKAGKAEKKEGEAAAENESGKKPREEKQKDKEGGAETHEEKSKDKEGGAETHEEKPTDKEGGAETLMDSAETATGGERKRVVKIDPQWAMLAKNSRNLAWSMTAGHEETEMGGMWHSIDDDPHSQFLWSRVHVLNGMGGIQGPGLQ